ncbi:hypothetical protein P4S64_13595 [Vibrio sp. M60_M31a]
MVFTGAISLHFITIAPKHQQAAPVPAGVGDLVIGEEFIINTQPQSSHNGEETPVQYHKGTGLTMPKRNRSTLKNFFQPGNMPSADAIFADLIDSCVNQVEDGSEKTACGWLAVDRFRSGAPCQSFYQQSDRQYCPFWHVGLAREDHQLAF